MYWYKIPVESPTSKSFGVFRETITYSAISNKIASINLILKSNHFETGFSMSQIAEEFI